MKSLKETKRELRNYWKHLPLLADAEKSTKDAAIQAAIRSFSAFRTAKQVASFASLDWEVNLIPLWDDRSVFPKVIDNDIQFFKVSSLHQLKPGFAGILEPPETLPASSWQSGDLILVPALAWDVTGARLGSGKGFYDRFLARLPAGIFTLGVGYSHRLSATPLPMESFDQRVNAIVTEKGIHFP